MSYIKIGRSTSNSISNDVTQYGADPTGTVISNNAITACIAANGSAYFPPGTFKVSNLLINSAKICGLGTIKKAPSATHAIILSGTDPEVDGLTFNTVDSPVNGESEINLADGCLRPVIHNCKFNGTTYSVISADINGSNDSFLTYNAPVDGLLFEKNKVGGSYSRHLYLHSVKNIRIVNNSFRDSARDSIRLRQATEKCLISGNTFDNIGEENGLAERPQSWSSLESFTLNTLVSIPTGNYPGIYKCIVANSTIGANPTTGGASEWSYINTHYFETKDVLDAYWSGVELIITNNIINKTAQYGLDIKGSEPNGAYSSGRVVISNNIIQNCFGCGINISSADLLLDGSFRFTSDYIISNNLLKGNNREQFDIAQSPIRLYQGVANCTISNNTIVENFARGITISNASPTAEMCRNIVVTGNQIYSNGISGGLSNIGINCSPVDGLIIQGNIIKNLPGSTVQTLGMNLRDYEIVGNTEFSTPRMTSIIRDNICTGNASNDRYEVLLNNYEFPALLAYVESNNVGVTTPVAIATRTMFSNGTDSGASSHINTQAYLINQGITLKARVFGSIGNTLSYEVQQQTGASKILTVTIAPAIFGGSEIIVKLPTDVAGNPVTATREEVENILKRRLGQGIRVYDNNGSQPQANGRV